MVAGISAYSRRGCGDAGTGKELSAEQTSAWDCVNSSWDQEVVEAHEENWVELFAQLVQTVLNDLAEGRSNALSVFMHSDTYLIVVF